jgi:hypothetical protein
MTNPSGLIPESGDIQIAFDSFILSEHSWEQGTLYMEALLKFCSVIRYWRLPAVSKIDLQADVKTLAALQINFIDLGS